MRLTFRFVFRSHQSAKHLQLAIIVDGDDGTRDSERFRRVNAVGLIERFNPCFQCRQLLGDFIIVLILAIEERVILI